jgi:hypothetical protein
MAVKAARPTLYAGVLMRSRLEASFAQHLDSLGFSWEYEPTCFASKDGQWLPDFKCSSVVVGDTKRTCYFEVKPSISREQYVEVYHRAVMTAWASEPDAAVVITRGRDWPVEWRHDVAVPGESKVWGDAILDRGVILRVARSTLRPAPVDPTTGRAVLGGRARRTVKEVFPGADLPDDVDLSMLVDDPAGPGKT